MLTLSGCHERAVGGCVLSTLSVTYPCSAVGQIGEALKVVVFEDWNGPVECVAGDSRLLIVIGQSASADRCLGGHGRNEG